MRWMHLENAFEAMSISLGTRVVAGVHGIDVAIEEIARCDGSLLCPAFGMGIIGWIVEGGNGAGVGEEEDVLA